MAGEGVKGATSPEEILVLATKVMEASALVAAVGSERLLTSEGVRVRGGFVVTGGKALREMGFVLKLGGPVGPARTSTLAGAIMKVQELVRATGLSQGVTGKVWMVHASDEIL